MNREDLIGMIGDGNGKEHAVGMVTPILVDRINLRPLCLLGPRLISGWCPHGWVAIHLTLLVVLLLPGIRLLPLHLHYGLLDLHLSHLALDMEEDQTFASEEHYLEITESII